MANLLESSTWETGIYQLEGTDVVRGGPVADGGVSNTQAQQLGNRTKYLYDRLGTVGGIAQFTISADASIAYTDLYDKQVMLTLSATGKVVTLDAGNLPDNAFSTITIIADTSGAPPACIKVEFGSINVFGGTSGLSLKSRLWLYMGESLTFTKFGNAVFIINLKGSHDTAGEIIYKPFAPLDAIAAKGQLVAKANYPRLWQYASDNGLVIADSTWLGSITRQGLFASSVSTTFRIPDLRGVFLRSLDNGRGIDIDRPFVGEGVYQADEYKSHTHSFNTDDKNGRSDNANDRDVMVPGSSSKTTSASGGIETRPKNIAYTAYIRY